MKTNTNEIDELIKETLTEEEAKFYDSLDEQNLWQMITSLYRGKNSWMVVVMNAFNVIALVLAIYCLIQTFDVEKTNDLILWIAGFFFCFMLMSMFKIYAWMQIHKNALTREIKRLELQVSSLSNKISE
ncbi:DUF6768 family protein [Winogradskyella jejuensis]|uniref:Uncharacterized protein n=1 Tax=Winogradskyella jejuensis TaxID=1089305 RepID=A0A1M5TE87_9FLAO|nr:DUF6768 family protein [Winogradskyella jejuensis]SHH49042.1 hypothetical protein SAMN05444148_2139 [Winogradskyella jejuensis]